MEEGAEFNSSLVRNRKKRRGRGFTRKQKGKVPPTDREGTNN